MTNQTVSPLWAQALARVAATRSAPPAFMLLTKNNRRRPADAADASCLGIFLLHGMRLPIFSQNIFPLGHDTRHRKPIPDIHSSACQGGTLERTIHQIGQMRGQR